MAYDFQRLDQVTKVSSVSNEATVIVEEDGNLKRVTANALKGFDAVLQIDCTNPGESLMGEATLTMIGGSHESVLEKIQTSGFASIGLLFLGIVEKKGGKQKKATSKISCIAQMVINGEYIGYEGAIVLEVPKDVMLLNALAWFSDDYIDFSCFVAGTQVQYNLDGSAKNIEDFSAGDTVIAYSIKTHQFYEAEVYAVERHENARAVKNLVDMVLADGKTVTMTPEHPILTNKGFRTVDGKKYKKLSVGDSVRTINGYSEIVNLNVYESEPTAVYNLKVRDFDEPYDVDTNDTYIANGIVVHNAK